MWRVGLFVAVVATGIEFKGLAQHHEGTLQVVLLQHVGDTHLVAAGTGGGIEALGRSHHHGLTLVAELFETPAAELLAVVDRELGHSVEGAHRDGRIDAGDAVEAVDETLAALHILVVDIAVILLGSIERRLGHNLSDKGW